ncbi:MAG: ParB/RepB/Spo0J family partition protein [Parcubacteria group bacterium]|nr:ParB/RepB/Spo0J family partition protein [Parcubacteria group bacterium]
MASSFNNSIFWVEVEKIKPNPFQPRKEFDEHRLNDLADSVRQYGILQPLVVTRKEVERTDGGLHVEYELIAGERRLRAAKIAGLGQVPVVIRVGDEDNEKAKLEIAIIENVQREDLNPVDRARAFKQLVEDFGFKHQEVANKISKSREYVSNSVRLLTLPQEIIDSLGVGTITEGHARPLLMLSDKPEEQLTLHKEIVYKKLTVREAERIARHAAYERTRKRSTELNPELLDLEEKLTKTLGTRVQVESRGEGGKITIDYFSPEELETLLNRLSSEEAMLETESTETAPDLSFEDSEKQNKKDDEEYLYSVKNFTI